MTNILKKLDEVLAKIGSNDFDTIDDAVRVGIDSAIFLRDHAPAIRAALEAVGRGIEADVIAYSRPPMRAVTGIAVDDGRLAYLAGTRVLIIPADAVGGEE